MAEPEHPGIVTFYDGEVVVRTAQASELPMFKQFYGDDQGGK